MIDPVTGGHPGVKPTVGGGPGGTPGEEARLRKAAQQLEGVFVEQLFKAMRETVPEGGLVDGGSGEEIFAGMLDQHFAAQVPAEWGRGLGAAVFRQLRAAITQSEAQVDTLSTTGDGA